MTTGAGGVDLRVRGVVTATDTVTVEVQNARTADYNAGVTALNIIVTPA